MDRAAEKLTLAALVGRWKAARAHKARLAALDRQLHSPYGPPDETGHIEMPLSAMRPGEFGHVLSLCPDCPVRQHILEMGFTAGTEVRVIRVAPLGDPLTVSIRGYQLSLRRREAAAIHMRRCPPEILDPDRGE
jgi:ferrous iron transport protein A